MLKAFILGGLIFTVCGGWMFGLMSVGGMPDKGEWGKRIIAIVVSFAVGFGLSGALTADAMGKQKDWNDGVCPECGTPWRFASAEHLRHGGTIYYYVCDNCGKIIEQGG